MIVMVFVDSSASIGKTVTTLPFEAAIFIVLVFYCHPHYCLGSGHVNLLE